MVDRSNGRISSDKIGSSHGHLYYSLYTLTSMTPRVFRVPYPRSSYCEVPMEDPTNRGLFRPLPVDLFPPLKYFGMPGESQSTFTLSWFRMCSIINLPYFLVPEWRLKFEKSTWAEPRSKAIEGKAGSQTASQSDGKSVDVPDMT